MKVIADNTMCEGNLECMFICPEVFAVDTNNQVKIKIVEIPVSLEEDVSLAVQACPRAALAIRD